MLVFRIETQEGKGIYGAGFGHRFTRASLEMRTHPASARAFDLASHPSPDEEPELRVFWLGLKLSRAKQRDWELNGRREWFCGFNSMEQLLEWWPHEGLRMMWKAMLERGQTPVLVTYKINANQVKAGSRQCVFKKSKGEVVDRRLICSMVP